MSNNIKYCLECDDLLEDCSCDNQYENIKNKRIFRKNKKEAKKQKKIKDEEYKNEKRNNKQAK